MKKTSGHKFSPVAAVPQRPKPTDRPARRPVGKPIKVPANGAHVSRDTQKFHREIAFYRRRFKDLIQELDNLFEQIGNSFGGPWSRPGRDEAGIQPPCEFSQDQIRATAYFIWEAEGCPACREKEHWSMAIERLRRDHPGSGGA